MPYLRALGIIVAAGLLALVIMGRRRGTLRPTDTVIMAVVALAIGLVSAAPSVVDPILRRLGLPPGNARRVIGVLLL